MAVKIRLMRIGSRKRPYFRVVAVDERKKRTGAYLELLGTYNPLTEPKEIKLDQGKIDEWVKKGAVLSDGFLRIIGKAPQRPPRKAKKEKAAPPQAPKEAIATPEVIPDKDSVTQEAVSQEAVAETTQDAPLSKDQIQTTEVVPTEESPAGEVEDKPEGQPEVASELPETTTNEPQTDETDKTESVTSEEKA